MTEAVQEQEMAFWDMWQKSQRASMDTEGSTAAGTEAPNQEDGVSQHPDATPPKYAKPASKGAGHNSGRGKGKRSNDRESGSSQTWHDKSSRTRCNASLDWPYAVRMLLGCYGVSFPLSSMPR